MIVIAIIGILAAALFPSLTAYLKRSRDAGRAANLNTISTAVGAHYSDTEKYPVGTSTGCVNGSSIDNTNYFPKGTPQDPQGGNTRSACALQTSGKANYGYGSATAGTGFVISALMENTAGGNYGSTATYTGATIYSTDYTAWVSKGTGATFLILN